MTPQTVPAEPRQQRSTTDGLRLGGALWVMAGLCCAGLVLVVFVGENLLMQSLGLTVLFSSGAVAALLVGGRLLARPTPGLVRWSSVVGMAWLLIFGSLILAGLGSSDPDRNPLLSLALIIGFGVGGALVTYRSGSADRRA